MKFRSTVYVALVISLFKLADARASGETFYSEVVNKPCANSEAAPVTQGTACTVRLTNSYSDVMYWLQVKDGKGNWRSLPYHRKFIDATGDFKEDIRFRVQRSQTYRLVADINGKWFSGFRRCRISHQGTKRKLGELFPLDRHGGDSTCSSKPLSPGKQG